MLMTIIIDTSNDFFLSLQLNLPSHKLILPEKDMDSFSRQEVNQPEVCKNIKKRFLYSICASHF